MLNAIVLSVVAPLAKLHYKGKLDLSENIRLKLVTDSYKYSSLLRHGISYGRKKFYYDRKKFYRTDRINVSWT
jgi:hypothetical protein